VKERWQEFWEIIWEFLCDSWDLIRRGVDAIGGWFWAIYAAGECLGCLLWLVSGLAVGVAAFWKLIGQGAPT